MATKFTQEAHHAPPWGDLAVEKAGRQPIRRERWWKFAFRTPYSIPEIPTAGMGPAEPSTVWSYQTKVIELVQTIGKDV